MDIFYFIRDALKSDTMMTCLGVNNSLTHSLTVFNGKYKITVRQVRLRGRYDRDCLTTNYQSGFSSLNEATTKLYNKTAEATLDEQTNEQIMFYKRAKKVSEETGVDLPTILSGWRYQQKTTRPPEAADTTPGNPDSVVTK